ncbi:MAG: T9SS type A sorting domain-containing protein [Crocinitomicaceae bacterium]|nr:T9SS type A sorting domain-containing protein [Crocinitomicaceae bacterium]
MFQIKLFFKGTTNYGGFSKTLNDKLSLFTSQTSSDEKIIILENSYENLLAYQHYLFYYYGTNINASINIAHHFKIFNGFYLNISIGYSYREIKYKYFNKTLNYYDLSYFSDNRYFYKGVHLLDLGIGLSYTFGRNHQVEKAKKQNEINTSTLNKGMYFIQLEKQSFTVKFTK